MSKHKISFQEWENSNGIDILIDNKIRASITYRSDIT